MNKLAPIAFFGFRRPEHTLQALTSLSRCHLAEDSQLFIFCDAAKNFTQQENVQKVREIARSKSWCGSVQVIERERNLGLKNSIDDGVSRLCKEFGRIIVLEDDILVSRNFLTFMNHALNLYEFEERVMQISAYNYPVHCPLGEDAFFIQHSSCWGWATWNRAWEKIHRESSLLTNLKKDPKLKRKFDMNDSYPYFKMLQQQTLGEIDSWGILWYSTIFEANGLTLMPRLSMVKNFGADGTGTHGKGGYEDIVNEFLPHIYPQVLENENAYRIIADFLRSKKPNYWRKLLSKIVSAVR
jgi:hypothetical protein